jgi:hypothetical protein
MVLGCKKSPTLLRVRHLALMLSTLLGSALVVGCQTTAEESTAEGTPQALGFYDLTTAYAGSIADTYGWIVELQVPGLTNEAEWGVIGQWYNALETGLYHNGASWSVYYFDDGNGPEGRNPDCGSTWGEVGSICGGPFANLQPGQRVAFKYERCTSEHVPSVAGTQLCLSADLKDGAGFRFLTEDAPGNLEMYNHVENFGPLNYIAPSIRCDAPIKMLGQQLKRADGTWENITGADKFRIKTLENGPYEITASNFSASPATWEICSPPHGEGDGLFAEYFDNTELSGEPILTRVDPRVDFLWQLDAPAPGVPADGFSVRWTGQVVPVTSGTYTVTTQSDDGVRLWLDGQLIIDNFTPHGTTEDNATVEFIGGRRYSIKMEYFDSGAEAVARLIWKGPEQRREVIPQWKLFSQATACAGVATWASGQNYSAGTQVVYEGHLWAAEHQVWWSNPACPPLNPAAWCAGSAQRWLDLGACQ